MRAVMSYSSTMKLYNNSSSNPDDAIQLRAPPLTWREPRKENKKSTGQEMG